MNMNSGRFETILILQCRGLGDALISTSIINAIHKSWRNAKIDIWASPEIAVLFQDNPAVNRCYIQSLPIIRRYKFTWSSVTGFITAIRSLRARRYDLCMNLVGDFRENLLTSLVGAKTTWAIAWDTGHPFRKIIRPGLSWLIGHNEYISKDIENIYDVYNQVAVSMGAGDASDIGSWGQKVFSPENGMARKRVAIHPLAGQACREWQFEKWNRLVEGILEMGCDVAICAEAGKHNFLDRAFEEWINEPRVVIHAGGVREFFRMLASAVAFVGLDSFGVHAAGFLWLG